MLGNDNKIKCIHSTAHFLYNTSQKKSKLEGQLILKLQNYCRPMFHIFLRLALKLITDLL